MILATQEESIARAGKSDEPQAKAEEETSSFRRRNREAGIINCGSNEPIRAALGRRIIKPSSDPPVDTATGGRRGAVWARGSFPRERLGWEMTECSDAGNSFK